MKIDIVNHLLMIKYCGITLVKKGKLFIIYL